MDHLVKKIPKNGIKKIEEVTEFSVDICKTESFNFSISVQNRL